MSRAIDAAPPSNASVLPVGHRPARQLKPILIDARRTEIQTPLLRVKYHATIMGAPRHRPSHPDCRWLLTQIAALQLHGAMGCCRHKCTSGGACRNWADRDDRRIELPAFVAVNIGQETASL